MSRTTLRILGALALLLLAACDQDVPHSSATPTHTAAPSAPTAVAIASAAPILFAPTPESGPPVFSASSIAFTSTLQGWVLGELCTGASECTVQVRVTHDGGRTYEPTPATLGTLQAGGLSPAATLSISFTDSRTGWVTGLPRLLISRDGGHSWADGGLAAAVAVAPLGSSVWALASGHLYLSGDEGSTWRPAVDAAGTGQRGAQTPALVRLSATDGYVVDAPGTVGDQDDLLVTRDAWHTWVRRQLPCRRGDSPSVAAVTLATVWAVCPGQPSAGNQRKEVDVSFDAGRTWQTRAEECYRLPCTETGSLGSAGYVTALTVRQDGRLFLAMDRRATLESADGTTWTEVTALPLDDAFSQRIDFADRDHGWVISGDTFPQPLWATTDGGIHWSDLGAP